ncbi:secreted sugar hydrolase, partial [Chytriomyces cf. hyalinus JEL632]
MKSLIALLLPLCLSTLVAARVSFAPYIDATTSFDPVAYHTLTGTMEFSLGFVTAGPGNGPPQWNGNLVSSGYYKGQIAAIRAFGGDIRISFGGAANQELALAASDATTLANTYIQVLQTYSATYADFDIEGGAVANRANVDLRNQALAKVQATLPSLKISYTLPVSTGGLTNDGIYLVQSAAKYNVKIDCLNIMAMDYYENIPYKDSNGNSLMGQYAIASTKATYKQVASTCLCHSIGITPMIGVNDDVNEVFTLADAAQVAAFAASTSYVSMVSFWVVAAD